MTNDTIYNQPLSEVKDFAFDEQVAGVFDDMIGRSVPLYAEAQLVTSELVRKLCRAGDVVYDLGCATGTTLALILEKLQLQNVRLVGIDNSEAMLAKCRERFGDNHCDRIEFRCSALENVSLPQAGFVILNYTLQFIMPNERPAILQRIYNSLRPGGALILSEKICHKDPFNQQLITELHHDFKRRNNYSDLEISQKRTALENVLVPLTMEQNTALLKESGFEHIAVLLKWHCFATFLAVKSS